MVIHSRKGKIRASDKKILEKINPAFEYEVIEIIRKDSLDLDSGDRIKIYEACSKLDEKRILIKGHIGK